MNIHNMSDIIQNDLIREKSCGAVVWRDAAGARLYLIEEMRAGHFSIPKGHAESGESERQTAEREILEETGLSVTLDASFRETISYEPYPGCLKEVVFFCAAARGGEIRLQEEEVRSVSWLAFEPALARLSFESDRGVLRLAHAHLERESLKNS